MITREYFEGDELLNIDHDMEMYHFGILCDDQICTI